MIILLAGCSTASDRDRISRRTRALYGPETAVDTGPSLREPDPALFETPQPLSRYIEIGLERSASLRAAYEDWRASTERLPQVTALPDPRLTYGEFLEQVQTRTGPQYRRFGISQAFPWPGELGAKGRMADREAEAAWYRVESERLRIASQIEIAFHEYAFLGRELAITTQLLELLHSLDPIVQSRVRAGAGQRDLLRLQVEIGRLDDDLASIVRRKPAASARLADSLNLPGSRVLPLPELVEPSGPSIDAEAAYELARTQSPLLRELGEQIAAGEEAVEVAGYRGLPSFALGFEYFQTGRAVNPMTSGSGDDPYLLSLSVSLPIWRDSYAAAEREARHRARSAEEELRDAETRLHTQIEEQAFRVDDSARRIALYRDTLIPRARESLQLTMSAYRTGEASVLDLIDSERALLEFDLSFWRACRELWISRARLKALMGGDMP
ncbi:MAG: TolC family protein [Planctomycetota bacterium]